MEVVLLVIQLFVALAIILVVLIQPPENLQLGGMGSSNPLAGVGTRGQGNALTRITAILAIIFVVLSLVLAILAGNHKTGGSILDVSTAAPAADAAATATTPTPAAAPDVPVAPVTEEPVAPSVPLAK